MAIEAPLTSVLLQHARDGDVRAADLLFPRVYGELRRLAAVHVGGGREGHTLNATALVHEAYIKLVGADSAAWENRSHFTAIASRAMRQILTDHARARGAAKRGGGAAAVTLDPDRVGGDATPPADDGETVLAVDAALDRLAALDGDLARLVELRFFGGLDVDEAAEILAVSPRTAARMWARAKAHLRADMGAP